MTNDLDIAKQESSLPTKNNNTYKFEQTGEGTNIGLAQNVTSTTVNIMLPTNNSGSGYTQNYIKKTINTEFFNLFVILGEQYDKPYFIVDVKRALTVNEGTAQNIHNRLATFTEEAKAEIMSYPCIFATENYRYSPPETPHTGPQLAQYGFITKIQQMHNGDLKIYFQSLPMCPIPQETLNHMITELDLQGNEKVNEFDRTHWAIKNVNVVEELKLKGISLLIPSI
ncbi:hypothetical protein QLT09_01955 [Streptococcus equi subsp. zooepidemicus]|jgi:hypothetical protein|uniref:hypothetical protein n=1 Tax=Streptococcus equi TaxID=1336 RepID=UPI00197FFEF0|nr:hypothetical protein [Streptococcus equi]MDI5917432.1 hypothetical protein [Streptococcus equi subsp. zooepidemicus]MDI5955575.1 hypothetical protein [Streptococcus equi subsp. zooepidemicus]QUQ78387.1 hypothetical protein JDBNIEOD_01423 [Streptococcus equi subsp. zooepidemicus]HEL1237633.1 hypothetical protein [Streptococcus equi subsp. zooepidemicus]